MSSGAECRFTEVSPGRWSYWLQEYPYGSNEDGTTYGPFRSYAVAYEHLHDNHQNPGGHSVAPLSEGHLHEWAEGHVSKKVGFVVEVGVVSLGPDATQEDVLALVKGLAVDSQAWRVRPEYGQVKAICCVSCGKEKESA